MYHFEKKTLKNLEIFERKIKNGPFLKKSLGSPMSLVQRFFFFLKIFLFFWENFGNLEFFFFYFFCFVFFNIYTQTKLIKCYIKFLNSKKNIETWNKQTNFKLNHDVTNQMWSKVKLGHSLLLGLLRMLEAWCA